MKRLGIAVMLALAGASIWAASAAAQDAKWTPLSISKGYVIFALGGPETHAGSREIALAIVPPPGTMQFKGRGVGFFLNFYTVNCSDWTERHHTVHMFGSDSAIFDIETMGEPTKAIVDALAIGRAARLKCRSDPGSVTGAVEQSQLITTASAIRERKGN